VIGRFGRVGEAVQLAEVQRTAGLYGNWASVGDVIITRRNDRRLRLSGTDWVKNGTAG
jgi:hypothetical protein